MSLFDDTYMENTSAFIPFYNFSPSLNAGYLKELVPLIVRHKIPANPINYAICYDYVVGNNPALTEAVNVMIADQRTFDYDTSLELYRKYICNASLESLEKINQRIHKVIEQATTAINETYHKAESANDNFKKKSVILEKISEKTDLQAILKEIIHETNSLAATSYAMQTKLVETHDEIEQLQSELSQVRKIATTDGLTGLLNRRAFDIALAEFVEQSNSQNTCLSILDIDYFKRINDTFGHVIGDNVIKYVASLMKTHAEDHHLAARYGGEELAIIMPNTSDELAIEICERIRNAMQSSNLKRKNDNQPLGEITLSIGVTKLKVGDDCESLINRADSALYKAKQIGRNNVVYF